jgi:bifunctional ADP-heptose synthase (sugar kinase/adenylyltransferase)
MDIAQHKKYKILLIGDNGVDQYQYGTVDRLSPEAPVPVLAFIKTESKPGMAANVKENLLALNCDVDFEHGIKTCIKTRIIDLKSKQQLLRIDQDALSRPVNINYDLSVYDAIVISDYNKGSVTYELVEKLITTYKGPIFVDTKKTDLQRFEGCFVKINHKEYEAAKTFPNELIVTLGSEGVKYKDKKIPASNVEAFDVCGAGDTFLSALTYGYLESKNIVEAIEFAVKASTLTIQHIGVYAPTLEEIKNV